MQTSNREYLNAFNLQPKDNIPNNHHIIRYLKPNQYQIDPLTNEVEVMLDGFYPRAQDQSLSVNWCEYYGDNREQQITSLKDAPGMPYDKKGRGKLALFLVENLKTKLKKLSQDGFNPQVIYSPSAATPSHASIIDIPLLSAHKNILKRFNFCLSEAVLEFIPATPKAL